MNQPLAGPMARRHYFAIGALAATTIFCETALTRLFSVVQYYHGAFLAISVALFGFAVSGVFVLLRGEAFARERLDGALARYALSFSLAIPLAFYSYVYVGVATELRLLGLPAFLAIACEYALLALPFFGSGVCVSLLLLHGAREANRLYAADLGSSALGAVAVIPALSLLGGPKSMLVASALAALSALPFSRRPRPRPRSRRWRSSPGSASSRCGCASRRRWWRPRRSAGTPSPWWVSAPRRRIPFGGARS
jgi:hypothetical protein